jgi:membrane-associated phospholipid phosphatase
MQNPEKKLLLTGILVALLCTLSYFFFDRQAAHYFLSVDPEIIAIFRVTTEGGDSLYSLLVGGLAFLIGRNLLRGAKTEKLRYWSERAKVWGAFLFVSVATSGLLSNLFKVVLGRSRPIKMLTENLYGFHFFEFTPKMMSLPSGHSNTAAATALVLWYLWPKSWPLGLLLFGGVALSRVALIKHFPADTLAGAYLALVTTFYIYRYFKNRFPHCFAKKAEA